MQKIDSIIIMGASNRPMPADLYLPEVEGQYPLVIYAHGFNGFKDWGNFSRVAKPFTDAGLAVLAFNFSHNGTTPENPVDFVDLEAFGLNNYTKQQFDLGCVLDWVCGDGKHSFPFLDTDNLFLIGHSMGGGMVILKAASDHRVRKVVGWASISHCNTPWGKWTKEKILQWQQDGVAFYENKRTHQQMPLYYQLYEDYRKHANELDILNAAAGLTVPLLICHGLQDPAVPVECAYLLKMAQPHAEIFITDGDHVFDRTHLSAGGWLPDDGEELPASMAGVVEETIRFLKG
ncbi:MAG: alpha/beta hydrolase-fold protein [Chitinophagaceae bacterium]|nr:alpha/beta hydrolase-fold protein [Chitinophagaceae bacterium]